MKIKELEELKECNELDILYKIINKAEKLESRTEDSAVGNKRAGIEVRKQLVDIRTLINIMRDVISSKNKPGDRVSALDKAIQAQLDKDKKAKAYLQKLEEKRYGGRQRERKD